MNIFVSGKAGAGKSCICKYLVEKNGYILGKFANPVYMIAEKYFKMKEKDRQLLQIIGTDAGRDYLEKDIWVNRFLEDIEIVNETCKQLNLPEKKFIVDDVRFDNEAITLLKEGWIGIWLNVNDEIRIKRLENRDGDSQIKYLSHKSEMQMDNFKEKLYQLDVSGTLEQSYDNLENLFNKIKRNIKSGS